MPKTEIVHLEIEFFKRIKFKVFIREEKYLKYQK